MSLSTKGSRCRRLRRSTGESPRLATCPHHRPVGPASGTGVVEVDIDGAFATAYAASCNHPLGNDLGERRRWTFAVPMWSLAGRPWGGARANADGRAVSPGRGDGVAGEVDDRFAFMRHDNQAITLDGAEEPGRHAGVWCRWSATLSCSGSRTPRPSRAPRRTAVTPRRHLRRRRPHAQPAPGHGLTERRRQPAVRDVTDARNQVVRHDAPHQVTRLRMRIGVEGRQRPTSQPVPNARLEPASPDGTPGSMPSATGSAPKSTRRAPSTSFTPGGRRRGRRSSPARRRPASGRCRAPRLSL